MYDLRVLCLGKQHLEMQSLPEQEKERTYSDRDLDRRHALNTQFNKVLPLLIFVNEDKLAELQFSFQCKSHFVFYFRLVIKNRELLMHGNWPALR